MKILKQGSLPQPTKKWWIGRECVCECCETKFILEEEDRVDWTPASLSSSIPQSEMVGIWCPTDGCPGRCTISQHLDFKKLL
ncbi:MAG: hypothetical protein AAB407_00650 [Patescibacteria group bacterium]